MGMTFSHPICVQVDNSQAVSFQQATCMASRLRGVIDLRRAWVQELRDTGKVEVRKVEGDNNKADVFTKCMPAYVFNLRL